MTERNESKTPLDTSSVPQRRAPMPNEDALALIDAAKGDWENGLFFCGANVGRVNRIMPVKELMQSLETEYDASAPAAK